MIDVVNTISKNIYIIATKCEQFLKDYSTRKNKTTYLENCSLVINIIRKDVMEKRM